MKHTFNTYEMPHFFHDQLGGLPACVLEVVEGVFQMMPMLGTLLHPRLQHRQQQMRDCEHGEVRTWYRADGPRIKVILTMRKVFHCVIHCVHKMKCIVL